MLDLGLQQPLQLGASTAGEAAPSPTPGSDSHRQRALPAQLPALQAAFRGLQPTPSLYAQTSSYSTELVVLAMTQRFSA